MSIVYCMMSQNSRMEQIKECVKRVSTYNTFDRKVIVINESIHDVLSEANESWLKATGCEIYVRRWNDNFPDARNAYLLKLQNGDIAVVSDADEWLCLLLCKDIKTVAEQMKKENIGLLWLHSHDYTVQENGEEEIKVTGFTKNLIFKKTPEVVYKGIGKAENVHETLIFPENTRFKTLPERYYYEHHKHFSEVLERATRNVFIGGGGNNVGDLNDEWVILRELCNKHSIYNWPDFKLVFNSLKRGGPFDEELIEWIFRNRRMGYDWENEMVDIFKWFRYLYPDMVPDDIDVITDEIPERARILNEVKALYLEVLGRHADEPGAQNYTRLVEIEQITLENVKQSLLQSPEYAQKFGAVKTETLGIEKLKIDVDINLTEEVIRENIFKRSTIFREKFLLPLRLGMKWQALMLITKKVETQGKGDDDAPPENFKNLISTFKELCPPSTYKHVLNIGAGAGTETKLLQDNGYIATGITFGSDNIKAARKKYKLELLEIDMNDITFPENYFDAAFSVQTFEHTFSPWLHILEMRRVLRDGGRYFIDVPDPDDEAMLGTIWHTNVLYPNQIKALFKKAGFFEVVDLSVKHRLAFCFEKLPDREFEMWGYVRFIMEGLRSV